MPKLTNQIYIKDLFSKYIKNFGEGLSQNHFPLIIDKQD